MQEEPISLGIKSKSKQNKILRAAPLRAPHTHVNLEHLDVVVERGLTQPPKTKGGEGGGRVADILEQSSVRTLDSTCLLCLD